MAQSNVIPLLSNDKVCEGFVQTPNENALGSYNSSQNQFLYFSYLHNDDVDENNDDAQTAYKRDVKEISKLQSPLGLKLTREEKGLKEISKLPPPLGLRLTMTQPANKKVEKLKASHFPIDMLMIGFFKIEARYPTDMVAKRYYAKRKLVWEILCDGLKKKIELQWRNISAIRAIIEENSPGRLEIELDTVPLFFREIELKPGKHTMWTASHDFTHGQASECRRHYVQFPPGVLGQHYAKLLQCDNRLMELSQKPFPTSRYAYFDSHLNQGSTHISFGHDLRVHGSKRISAAEQQPILVSPKEVQSTTPLSLAVIDHSVSGNELINNQMLQNPKAATFAGHLVSTQQVHLFGNTMPLSVVPINHPTSANYQLFDNMVPNNTTLPTSGICAPTNEAIHNQILQYPMLTSWNTLPLRESAPGGAVRLKTTKSMWEL